MGLRRFARLVPALLLAWAPTALADPPAKPLPKTLTEPGSVAKRIDRLMADTWKAEGLKPAPRAADAEFLRRVSLDLAGVIPSEKETRAFLRSRSKSKRADKIVELLSSQRHARSHGLRWAYLLVGRQYLIRAKGMAAAAKARDRRKAMDGPMQGPMDAEEMGISEDAYSVDEWLAARLYENTPWDEVASQLIAAEGRVDQNPAVHYMLRYARDGKAAEMAGSVMRVFQGLQVQCAQCHDHPYTETTQRDFWGLAAFFGRTNVRRAPPTTEQVKRRGKKAKGPFLIAERRMGQTRMPSPAGETGPLVLPKFLEGQVINPSERRSRRAALAALVTAKDNPRFARATVNRVWSFFFGRGIISPVDEINQEDFVHPDVMALLERDFTASGFDLRRLMQVIVSTRAYQLSSEGEAEGREDALALFARAPLRSLSAEQLFYSVLEASGAADVRVQDRRARRALERRKFQLLQQFVRTFGEDEGEEVVDEGTIPEALMLLNGPLTNDAVRPRPGHPVYQRLFELRDVAQRVRLLYLRVLSRPPTQAELVKVQRYLAHFHRQGPQATARAYADVVWALLNSSEFNLIH
jgi:hypothetical protein